MLNFTDFLIESSKSESLFNKFPELLYKKLDKGLNPCGKMVVFIYNNPGLTSAEIHEIYPSSFPEKDIQAALKTPYVKRTETKPRRYYANPDPSVSIDQIIYLNRGVIQGRKFGI